MAKNIEIKARIRDLDSCVRKAESLSGKEPETISQDDTFFNCRKGRLKLRMFSKDKGELIFYNRPDEAGPKTSEYFITSTHEPGRLRDVLERSYGSCGRVKKVRKLYMIGRTRVHLDTVENLGRFIEFEVVLGDGEDITDGENESRLLMKAFNISESDVINCAYVDMF